MESACQSCSKGGSDGASATQRAHTAAYSRTHACTHTHARARNTSHILDAGRAGERRPDGRFELVLFLAERAALRKKKRPAIRHES